MTFPRYPAYKDSGVTWLGEVPEHWEVKRLKLIASHNDETLDDSTDPDFEILYVDISSVDPVAGITAKDAMPFSVAPSRARRKVRDGDAIVSTVRTYLRAIARITEPEENLVVSTGFAVIRPSKQVFHGFLGYLLTANFFVDEVISRSVGVSYPAINASDLMRISVPVPVFADQQTIATFLDRETAKIDALIAEQRSLTALLKEKRQAVISHAVTKGLNPKAAMKDSGVAWLGEVPGHWEVIPLGSLANQIQTGPFGSQLHSEEYVDDETPVINPSNIQAGKLIPDWSCTVTSEIVERLSRHKLILGDIIFARRGEMGRCAMITEESVGWLCGTGSLNVRLSSKGLPEFVASFLSTTYVRELLQLESVGSTMDNLNTQILGRVAIPTPPMKEQKLIVAHLNHQTTQIDTLIAETQTAITLLQERRSALISAAVTGKMDVRKARWVEDATFLIAA